MVRGTPPHLKDLPAGHPGANSWVGSSLPDAQSGGWTPALTSQRSRGSSAPAAGSARSLAGALGASQVPRGARGGRAERPPPAKTLPGGPLAL